MENELTLPNLEEIEEYKEDLEDEESDEIEDSELEELEEIEPEITEEQETPKEPNKPKTEKEKQKDLLNEMRFLLVNYPLKIEFTMKQDVLNIINNLLLGYDLLVYCSYKTNKEEIKELIEKELNVLENNFDLSKIRSLNTELLSKTTIIGNSDLRDRMFYLIEKNIQIIHRKVQLFILSVPTKGKPFINIRNAMGAGAGMADEYESSEIEDGQKIDPNKSFNFDEEGKLIQL